MAGPGNRNGVLPLVDRSIDEPAAAGRHMNALRRRRFERQPVRPEAEELGSDRPRTRRTFSWRSAPDTPRTHSVPWRAMSTVGPEPLQPPFAPPHASVDARAGRGELGRVRRSFHGNRHDTSGHWFGQLPATDQGSSITASSSWF